MNTHYSVFATALLSLLMASNGLLAEDQTGSRGVGDETMTNTDMSRSISQRSSSSIARQRLSLGSLPLGSTLLLAADAEPSWRESSQPLFDGESLAGWQGDPKIFRIEQGAIVGGTLDARIPRNAFLSTKDEYGNFELRLKFKLLGEGSNAGVQIRSRRIPDHHEMIGYQADLGNGWWGCLYDESRRRKILAGPKPKVRDQLVQQNKWNEYRIRCEGPRIQLWINGTQTVDYTEADPDIEQKGLIAVQIHGGPPSEAWYKDIRVRELP